MQKKGVNTLFFLFFLVLELEEAQAEKRLLESEKQYLEERNSVLECLPNPYSDTGNANCNSDVDDSDDESDDEQNLDDESRGEEIRS